jgi:hypothetical protein
MKSNTVLFLEFMFFDAVALAFGVWQWWTVRPRKPARAEPAGSGEGAKHPEG